MRRVGGKVPSWAILGALLVGLAAGLSLLAGCANAEYYQAVQKINEAWASNPRYLVVESKDGTVVRVPLEQGKPMLPNSPGQDFALGANAVAPAALGGLGFHYMGELGKAAVGAARGNQTTITSSGTTSPVEVSGGNGAPQTGTQTTPAPVIITPVVVGP